MKKKILFYGDSNTYGYDGNRRYGYRFPESVRWTNQLQKLVKDSWRVVADGECGREIPASGYGMQPMDQTILNCIPLDIFAIMLGSNDLLNMPAPDPDFVAGKMERLLCHVKKFCDMPVGPKKILLIAPPAIQEKGPYGAYAQASLKLAECYDELAEKMDVYFADASSLQLTMATDGVHMEEAGHREFAGRMAQVLQNLLLDLA